MVHRVKEVKVLEHGILEIIFQNGVEKIYDVHQLYPVFSQFEVFEKEAGLFEQVAVDIGGCGISWNDELDLDAEELWDHGVSSGKNYDVDIKDSVGFKLTEAREVRKMTQVQLSQITGVYQADISKIERGAANPSVLTLQRLAQGLGMKLNISFCDEER